MISCIKYSCDLTSKTTLGKGVDVTKFPLEGNRNLLRVACPCSLGVLLFGGRNVGTALV